MLCGYSHTEKEKTQNVNKSGKRSAQRTERRKRREERDRLTPHQPDIHEPVVVDPASSASETVSGAHQVSDLDVSLSEEKSRRREKQEVSVGRQTQGRRVRRETYESYGNGEGSFSFRRTGDDVLLLRPTFTTQSERG